MRSLNDDPVMDAAYFIENNIKQTHKLEAYLDIMDLLYVKGPVRVGDVEVDAVVNVSVVQTGKNKLEIEYFEVVDDLVDIIDKDGSIMYISYLQSDKTNMYVLMENFRHAVEEIAFEVAKNTSEEQWNYRLIE